jgi:DNA repair protein RadC
VREHPSRGQNKERGVTDMTRRKAGTVGTGRAAGAVIEEHGERSRIEERDRIEEQLRYRVPEIRLALIRERSVDKPVAIGGPVDAAQFLTPLRYESEEKFIALHLNAMNEVMGYRTVSHGTLSSSLVHPREVFKAAILDNAFGLIVAHNHPAGSRKPSIEDRMTTKQLIASGKLLGVPVIDHLIITPAGDWTSVREELPELWEED